MSFFEWQTRFSSEDACAPFLAERRWSDGFLCACCGHEKAHFLRPRRVYPCACCRQPVSVTAGTLFHSTNLPLRKGFWAVYWVASDQGRISALRLSKLLGVSWSTAQRMWRKLRICLSRLRRRQVAMGHRERRYRLSDWLELDEAFAGGQRAGKRGRGAEGKAPVLVACEDRDQPAGFLAMETVPRLTHRDVAGFAQRRLAPQ